MELKHQKGKMWGSSLWIGISSPQSSRLWQAGFIWDLPRILSYCSSPDADSICAQGGQARAM